MTVDQLPEDDMSDVAQSPGEIVETDDDLTGCRPPLWLIGLMLVVLLGAAFIGAQVFAVLYGLVFPPDAPRPDDAIELSHESIDNRVDEWEFQTALMPCEVVAFYEDEGSQCVITENACVDGVFTPPVYEVPYIAECTGVEEFAVFALRWRATVHPVYRPDPDGSTFTLFSEVLWGGPPQPTSTPNLSQ